MIHVVSGGRAICVFAACLLVAPLVRAEEDFAARFAKAVETGPPAHAEKILAEWGKKEPDNPDYYIKGANYFYKLAYGGIQVSTKPAAKGDFVVVDPKTNKAVGSISKGTDRKLAAKANGLLEEASKRFPKRLDIWLGRAQLYEAFEQPADLIAVLKSLGAYVQANPAGLLGTDGRPYPEPVRVNLAQKFSGFAGRRYDLETKEGDQQFLAIATVTVDAFPDTVYGYNLLGNYYAAVQPDPPRAIENYRKALAIAPSDALVWSNLGEVYRRIEKFDDARAALGKVLELNNDPASVERAKKLLEKLPPP